jgi:hypothetical protein
MCMGGACKKCGAACKAPEPKQGAMKSGPAKAGGTPLAGSGLDVAKRNAAEAAAKARAKRF